MANVVSKRINIVSIKMVVEAGELLGIKLLDHLIIGVWVPLPCEASVLHW